MILVLDIITDGVGRERGDASACGEAYGKLLRCGRAVADGLTLASSGLRANPA
jgi:hypothetical protein